jgi:two-component system, OmpR family, phosphate regulon sensor histidine kinase PhoR
MFSSIRWRITTAFAAIVIICVAGTGIYLSNYFRDRQINELYSQLEIQANLIASLSDSYFAGPQTQELDHLAKQLGGRSGNVVTFISSSGQVLADSRSSSGDTSNLLNAPEVVQAAASGQGSSLRQSFMYYAMAINSGGQPAGFVRIAAPLTQIESAAAAVDGLIALALGVSILLSILTGLLLASRTMTPIKKLTQSVSKISDGDFDQDIPIPSRDEVGNLARALKSMANRLRETVELISTERDRMSAVLSQMGDAIFIVDSHSRITMINPAAEKIFQLPGEKILKRTFIEAIPYYELDNAVQLCLKTMVQETGFSEIHPSRQFLGIVATPLQNEKSCLVLIQDLTKLRRLETVRRDFVANISHELRTPLSSIKALSETLQGGALTEPDVAREFVDKINVETDRLIQMVRELGELSRIESGKAVLNRKPTNIADVIQNSVSRLKTLADRAGIEVIINNIADVPQVLIDKDRIEQVLINLIHNAIKFTLPPGTVTISVKAENNRLVVSVSDTGIGIPEDDLPRMFERFYKTDKARAGSGTGLGLSIARHTVQAHGGEIWVESQENKGSVFSFSLPLLAF